MYKLKAQNDKFMTTFELHRLIFKLTVLPYRDEKNKTIIQATNIL